MELVYCSSPNLVVEPHHYSDGVPVFQPTMEQFKDFYAFNKAINKYGMELGIVKVIPPDEWRRSLPKYTQKSLERIKIRNPIIQHINSSGAGVYSLQNIERLRTYSIAQWKELLNQSNYQAPALRGKLRTSDKPKETAHSQLLSPKSPQLSHSKHTVVDLASLPERRQLRTRSNSVSAQDTPAQRQQKAKNARHQKELQNFRNYNIDTSSFTAERCEQLESNYWKTLTYAEPMYGADSLGSLFPPNFNTWNVAHLPNILDLLDSKLPGVNDAYLYAGLWKATFSWHLEDQDLYSINYLHFGAPKQWYSIPQSQATKFYQLMRETFPEDSRVCLEFLRHKTYMMSPQTLAKHGITVNKIIHREGEFMITYPYGYHSGFNYGYNLAESVNFATDDWFPYGESSKKCECISDSVGINVRMLYCKFKGINYEVEERKRKDAEAKAISEQEEAAEAEAEAQANSKRKSKSSGKTRAKKDGSPAASVSATPPQPSPERIQVNYQCLLCPNNLAKSLTKLEPFHLLDTELPDKKVHRICAQQFKELKDIDNSVVKGFSDISKAQVDLKCVVCLPNVPKKKKGGNSVHGACFQCEHPKCVRSYHATCAIGGGFSFSDTGNNKCRFHRGKIVFHKANPLKNERISKIMRNSVVQFTTLNRDIFSGLVVANIPDESVLHVTVFPQLKERMEVAYDNVLVSDDPKVDVNQNTILLYKRKKQVKEEVETKKSLTPGPAPTTASVTGNAVDLARSQVAEEFSSISYPKPRITVEGNFITVIINSQRFDNKVETPKEWWYYVASESSETIGRYTNDYRSKLPNDPNYLKSLERKKKRTLNKHDKGNINTKMMKFTQVKFPDDQQNSLTLPTMGSELAPMMPVSGNIPNFTVHSPFFNHTNNANNSMESFIPANINHNYNQDHSMGVINAPPNIMHGRMNPYVNLTANR